MRRDPSFPASGVSDALAPAKGGVLYTVKACCRTAINGLAGLGVSPTGVEARMRGIIGQRGKKLRP